MVVMTSLSIESKASDKPRFGVSEQASVLSTSKITALKNRLRFFIVNPFYSVPIVMHPLKDHV
jgi:hypothetical protein